MAFDLALQEHHVQPLHHVRRRKLQRSEAAQRAAGHGAVKRRGRALAADVAHHDHLPVPPVGEEFIKVAPQLARGLKVQSHVQAGNFGRDPRHQVHLDFLGAAQVALQPRFTARHAFIQARILNGDGDLRRESGKDAHVVVVEIIKVRAFQIDHPDHAVAINQRDRHLRAGLRDSRRCSAGLC